MEGQKCEGKIVCAIPVGQTHTLKGSLVLLYIFNEKLYHFQIAEEDNFYQNIILTDGPSKLIWTNETKNDRVVTTCLEAQINPDIFSNGASSLDPESFKKLENRELISLKRKIEEEIERRREELNEAMLEIGFPSSGSES